MERVSGKGLEERKKFFSSEVMIKMDESRGLQERNMGTMGMLRKRRSLSPEK